MALRHEGAHWCGGQQRIGTVGQRNGGQQGGRGADCRVAISQLAACMGRLQPQESAAAQHSTARGKATVMAKVVHTFRVIKRQLGLVKAQSLGQTKHTGHPVCPFAPSNRTMTRRSLIATAAYDGRKAVIECGAKRAGTHTLITRSDAP